MKNLLEIKISKAQLKMIVGDAVRHSFPTKIVFKKVGHDTEKELPDTIKNIIKATADQSLKSFDGRFDNSHPLEVALTRIQSNGLNKTNNRRNPQ